MRHNHAGRIVMMIGLAALAGVPAHSQAPPKAPGEKYALLVGVRRYDPNELRSLPYTEADVVALAEVLRAKGYKPGNVVVMTQTAGAEDTRFLPLAGQVRKELKLILGDLQEEDSVLVAFAGHGVQFRGDPENYFCPADARLADKRTLIGLRAIYQDLEACGAGLKLLLVDACRNDPQSENSRARAVVNLEMVTRPNQPPPAGGVVAFFSCSEGEKAYEHADLKHGVFFNFVIQALNGGAAGPGETEVLLPDLEKYVKRQVRDFVREKYGVRQMPELKGTSRGLVPLVSLNANAARVPVAARPEPTTPKPRPAVPVDAKEITNSIGMKLALIPAGTFEMGSPESDKDAQDNEKPRHKVQITRPFYLGVYEVTQGQYKAVTGKNLSDFKGSDDLPVEQVSWNDAIAFCNKLSEREGLKPCYQSGGAVQPGGDGYRLPTEAEWEYACRAGSTTRFSFGDDEAGLGEFAWFVGNSAKKAHPVGQKRPNALGLYDMHGNVWEWCWDAYGEKYYAESLATDPLGPSGASDRVIRGGSWYYFPRVARSAHRSRLTPEFRDGILGFRLARVRSGP